MNIAKIRENVNFEQMINNKNKKQEEAQKSFDVNLEKIMFQAQVEAILEYLKLAEFDSKFLSFKLTTRCDSKQKNLIFVNNVDGFEKSDEFKNMIAQLESEGFNSNISKEHDGTGRCSWSYVTLTLKD